MPPDTGNCPQKTNMEAELYLLIAKFLSTGPCELSAEILQKELDEHQLLPKRIDWKGNLHKRSYSELSKLYAHIPDDHLLRICNRIGPLLDKEIPPAVLGINSLLGIGKQSLLRTKSDTKPKCQLTNLIARKNGMPYMPSNAAQSLYPPNIVQVLISREMSGSLSIRHTFTPKVYARQQIYRRILGHLSSVYCVLFDRTGKYIFTGADDLLVKIWSATDGRLLAALRGHSAEITDMAVNHENTLLAAGSCDKTIRVWCLKTMAPVAVLMGHTGMVTSLQFCPYPKIPDRLLISTGNDGCVCFWYSNPKTNVFNPHPVKFTEKIKSNAQMICSSFSQGGLLLATGSTDHHVRVYNIAGVNGPEKILEKEAHIDRVDSILFSHKSCRFVSGSKDGTASIWTYGKQNWSTIQLKMSLKAPGQAEEDTKIKYKVTMVSWTLDDDMVLTAVSDHTIKVWNSYNGTLTMILKGHEDEIFVLENHPQDPRIFLSSGHDGRIMLWDLMTGSTIKNHFNLIEGQGHGAVFDCKFSPDGQMFVSTDSHGHLSMFGFGSVERYKKVPEEQFFHTDYRPLIRDINQHVLDEQTQTAPHLLPPPFLVDIDGNPYPPSLQRQVPGRENCNEAQLIPYVAVSAQGDTEVLQPVRPANEDPDRPTIDDMIERMQQEHSASFRILNGVPVNDAEPGSSEALASPHSSRRAQNDDRNEPMSPRTPRSQAGHSGVGLRRTGDVEGVQSVGNWQSQGNQTELPSWVKRVVVRPMKESLLKCSLERRRRVSECELNFYRRESMKSLSATLKWDNEFRFKDRLEELNNERKSRPKHRKGLRAGLRSWAPETPAGNDAHETADTESSDTEFDEPEDEDFIDSEYSLSSDADKKKHQAEEKRLKRIAGYPAPRRSARQKKRTASGAENGIDDDADEEEVDDEMDDNNEDNDEEEEDEEEEEEEKTPRRRKKKRRTRPKFKRRSAKVRKVLKKPKKIVRTVKSKKLPQRSHPSDWLADVYPSKAPFVPQVGDEVVYFRQGHELYVQAVKRNNVYNIRTRDQPWMKMNLREQEVCLIDDITFENHPPLRLCCLKLVLINPVDSQLHSFVVKYHDMADVIDFMVLKQYYDHAMYHDWKPGDKFRSEIDQVWWLGTIKAQKPFNPRYPDSMFQCFVVSWDTEETEAMSPWDFEPIDMDRQPHCKGESVPVTPEEHLAMLYVAECREWSTYGFEHDCGRIIRGLTRIMELKISENFVEPVDLNLYPTYSLEVEYPMDLQTIKLRLENRYYRRLRAVKFDIKYISINAQKFNELNSRIVKQAKCLVDLCMRFLDSPNCNDPMRFYQEMMEAKHLRSQDSQSELDVLSDSDGEHHTSNRMKKKKKSTVIDTSKRIHAVKYTTDSWKEQCRQLLEDLFLLEDSTPFRYAVNLADYPDYRTIIDRPMDLSTVRDKLSSNHYEEPKDFCKDVRLIFQNSKSFNTNKKSRIYSMTIRLSATFEEKFRSISSDYESAKSYEKKIKNNQYVSHKRSFPDDSINDSTSSSKICPLSFSTDHDAYSMPGTSGNSLTNGNAYPLSNGIKRKFQDNNTEDSQSEHSSDDDSDSTPSEQDNGRDQDWSQKITKRPMKRLKRGKRLKMARRKSSKRTLKPNIVRVKKCESSPNEDEEQRQTKRPQRNVIKKSQSSEYEEEEESSRRPRRRVHRPLKYESSDNEERFSRLRRRIKKEESTEEDEEPRRPVESSRRRVIKKEESTEEEEEPKRPVRSSKRGKKLQSSECEEEEEDEDNSGRPKRNVGRPKKYLDSEKESEDSESESDEENSSSTQNSAQDGSEDTMDYNMRSRVYKNDKHRQSSRLKKGQSGSIQTRNKGMRTVTYNESEDSEERILNISSRGRLRKLKRQAFSQE